MPRMTSLVLLVTCLLASSCQGGRLRQASKPTCHNKMMTSYSRRMLDSIRPSSAFEGTLHLQQRFIAGVHLYAGQVTGMDRIQPIEEPTRLFCFNESIAALQTVSRELLTLHSVAHVFRATEVQDSRRRRGIRVRVRRITRSARHATSRATRLLY